MTGQEIKGSALFSIKSKRRLAQTLEWIGPPSALVAFSQRRDNYSPFWDKTNPAKPRLVEAPRSGLKKLQKRLEGLLKRLAFPQYLHSALPGRSYLTNSQTHCDAYGCTITLDVSNFYQSISLDRIVRMFIVTFRCERDVAEVIAHLLCCNGHLATGSPASPLVSFLACREIFDKIEQRANSVGGKFTLYIDDIALTGLTVGHSDIKWIERLLSKNNLIIKKSKTRLFPAKSAKVVTGRAFRDGVSRAPNKQHLKAKEIIEQHRASPESSELIAKMQGRFRHIAQLDIARKQSYLAAARLLQQK